MIEREVCLDKAKECVCGKREQDHGTPENNFKTIADLWNIYLNRCAHQVTTITKEGNISSSFEYGITAKDVAMMMSLLKIARIATGGGSGDSYVDLAGYAACGYELDKKTRLEDVANDPA